MGKTTEHSASKMHRRSGELAPERFAHGILAQLPRNPKF
jgi:hypothetical protein